MSDGCLGCQRCEDGPVVTLFDGRVVCNVCEDWRAECEARHVLAMPDKQVRREYLAAVEKKRGADGGKALSDLALKIWNAEKSNNTPQKCA